ncbi:MAG: hypothetical protein QNJ68_20530 [Microcoleaceae cyanobacterium MO_207.B10]|nr:hypothetical protein [Microcoleaceae cyanobacterium MO_207.B10]
MILSQQDKSKIQIIHCCDDHLLTLINDLLDLSKIEARHMEVNPTEFHFPAFLESVIEMCKVRAKLKGVSFVDVQNK